LKEILGNKQIVIGGIIIVLLILMAALAPLLTSYDYSSIDLKNKLLPPGEGHLVGTDAFGRDLWTRLVYGARVSLLVSLMSVALACICGTFLGLVGGYFGGMADSLIGRIIDIMMAFPALLLSILMGTVLGTDMTNLYIAIGFPLIPSFYRVVRGATLTVRERYFVRAAKSMGSSSLHILWKHILPNALPQMFVMISFDLGSAIMAESALGFLGLGIPAPTPSWGLIINEGKNYIFNSPWLIGTSGTLIALTVLAFNLLGDGLRDYLDPKLKK
jgi:peptide/nickel transport system permease protein